MTHRIPLVEVAAAILLLGICYAVANDTYVYAVQVSALVQTNPPQITLRWQPDPFGATSYTVYRKSKEAKAWGTPAATLPGSATSYVDSSVALGTAHEYQIVKGAILGYKGYGYIYSGINVPPVESRGTVILVLGSQSVVGLESEINQLRSDLVGDGWTVVTRSVSTNDTPESVRNLIVGLYQSDPSQVNTVFLLGHVPVLQSGYLDYDGHGARAMPADAYYGDTKNDWPTAPGSSPSYLPSDIPLMIGRVDLANMPGVGSATPWPNETELLRRYLVKNHAWRQKLFTVPRLALMGNRRGDEAGLAVAASAYRAFEPLVGPGKTVEANINNTSSVAQRWSSMLASGSYLWAYGCGAGQVTAISFLGTHGTYAEVWSTDIVDQDAHAVFVMAYGSHFGNWDRTDDILRSVLATPGVGLASFMSGEPHWYLHHMGLGETIGYSTRLSLNNSGLYQNQVNAFNRAVYIALMGDPTLRMEPVMPVPSVTALPGPGSVALNWISPREPPLGYYVYRAPTADGPFVRITSAAVTGNSFVDSAAPVGNWAYMVRALTLTTNPSGSYYNLSQGTFANARVTSVAAPIMVQVTAGPGGGVTLSWNSQPGFVYHVETAFRPNATSWINVSGAISATGATTTWTDGSTAGATGRFYRVAQE